jgi:predicted nucleic acid-binding protein
MSRTVAFLDACVLYPFSLRDVLIQFSVEGMFQAKWSGKVQAEVIKNVEGNNPKISGRLLRTFELMENAVPDFLSEPTQETIALVSESSTDPKDVEILAAAIDGACTHLVTTNLKDFDIAYGLARNVAVMHPDEFLEKLIENNLESARAGFEAVVSRCKKPPRSKAEYCEAFKKNRLLKTASKLEHL